MATAPLPQSALKYKSLSAATAARATREAQRVRRQGTTPVVDVIVRHQLAQAVLAERATALMLEEQGAAVKADAKLNPVGFTTSADRAAELLARAETGWAFNQLVASLVQDAGRAAQGVSQAARPHVGWTRVLTPPSCSRCAVLAGRVYRYSEGFLRHPHDDCTTVAVRQGDSRFVTSPAALLRSGSITDLSHADVTAIRDGAGLAQVVNLSASAGLDFPGRALIRRGRPTPEGIFRRSGDDREAALELLTRYGYLAA